MTCRAKPKLERVKHGGDVQAITSSISKLIGKTLEVPERIIDFSSNLNPFGPPKSLLKKIWESIYKISAYPSEEDFNKVKKVIAEFVRADEKNVLLFNGSAEAIQFIFLFYRPKKTLIFQPAFVEYELAAKSVGSQTFDINTLSNDFLSSSDLRSKTAACEITFICNPNNPTSVLIGKEDLTSLVKQHRKTLFVVDEAFIDFTEDSRNGSLTTDASNTENLIVIGSLTKLLAIPGIRIGFLVASKKTIDYLSKLRYPWPINVFAVEAALEGLADMPSLYKSLSKTTMLKKKLYTELLTSDFMPTVRPQANFLLLKMSDKMHKTLKCQEKKLPASTAVQKILLEKGILVRDCANFKFLEDKYIRVGVKKKEENKLLISALDELVEEVYG